MPEYNINDFIDIRLLQGFQDSFSLFTGIAAVITDTEGVCITRTSGYNCICKDDSAISADDISKCMKLYIDGAKTSLVNNKAFIGKCHENLYYIINPITLNDQIIGSMVCGQIICVDEEGDSRFENASDIKRMTYSEIEHIADYVYSLAKLISASVYKNYILIKSNHLRTVSSYSKARSLPDDIGKERIYNIHELTSTITAGIEMICKKFGIIPKISVLSKVPKELYGNPNAIQHVIEGLVSFLVPYCTTDLIEISFSCDKVNYSHTLVMNITVESENITKDYLNDIKNSFDINSDEDPEGASLITYITTSILNGDININLSENKKIAARLCIPQLDLKVK